MGGLFSAPKPKTVAPPQPPAAPDPVKGGGGVYRRAGEKMYRWGEA